MTSDIRRTVQVELGLGTTLDLLAFAAFRAALILSNSSWFHVSADTSPGPPLLSSIVNLSHFSAYLHQSSKRRNT